MPYFIVRYIERSSCATEFEDDEMYTDIERRQVLHYHQDRYEIDEETGEEIQTDVVARKR